MVDSEKKLEDYICEHQEEFINKLKELYDIEENIKFVGRQVYIGEHNIADLIYCYTTKEEIPNYEITTKHFIIVELKFRVLESKDLAQISRYITTLEDKYYGTDVLSSSGNEIEVKGVLLGFDLDNNMQEIQMLLECDNERIKFINIASHFDYNFPSYKHNDEYINKLKLDERIVETMYE